MRLGIAISLPHKTPYEWAKKHRDLGLSAVVFPCSCADKISKIDAYAKACREYGLTIAEVGAWKNVLSVDKKAKSDNFEFCKNQLELAEYVGAACCVNISGAKGDIWDGAYAENYSEKTYAEIVETVQKLIDCVNPHKTFYTLEPMPWMYPDSPESYLKLIKDTDRKAFAVHMDMVNMISDPKKYLFNEDYTNKAFELLGDYIKSCHVKDVVLKNNLTVHLSEAPCGQGGFNITNYIAQINKLSPDMPVIIEHLSDENDYIKAVEYIHNLQEVKRTCKN